MSTRIGQAWPRGFDQKLYIEGLARAHMKWVVTDSAKTCVSLERPRLDLWTVSIPPDLMAG
jgi:hypothetical protein